MTNERDIDHDVVVVEPATEAAPIQATALAFGIVSDCEKLNIRKVPTRNSQIVTIVPVNTELMVDLANSTSDWYSICTSSGIEGFCMKQYVTIQP